jgi:hypothetical protein
MVITVKSHLNYHQLKRLPAIARHHRRAGPGSLSLQTIEGQPA